MSSLPSFEYAFERETAADNIIKVLGHRVCEGLTTATWAVPHLGATCMLHRYDQRHIYQDGEPTTIPTPFFLLHAKYVEEGRDIVIMIDFEKDFSIPRRKVRQEPKEQQAEIGWNEAMGVCDETLRAGLEQAQRITEVSDRPALRLVR